MLSTHLSLATHRMASVSSKYTLHIDLPIEYSSFQSVTGKKNPLPEDMQCIYNEAPKSLDFWCNGSIYPPDPLTNSPPPFFKPTCFLRYVGDGYNGLLGYCIRLMQCNINSTMLGHQIQGMQCVINDQNLIIFNRIHCLAVYRLVKKRLMNLSLH